MLTGRGIGGSRGTILTVSTRHAKRGDQPFEARHTENAIRIALVLHVFMRVESWSEGPRDLSCDASRT